MASAYHNATPDDVEEDELDRLFKTFDSQFRDLQQKFTDLEHTLQEFRSEKSPEEEDSPH